MWMDGAQARVYGARVAAADVKGLASAGSQVAGSDPAGRATEEHAMHARMSVFEGGVERIDQMVDRVQSNALPILREQSGFKGFTLLAVRSSGRLVAVSYWEPESDM